MLLIRILNRHGKSGSKEDGTTETESTLSDSRQHKRKDRESSDSRREKNSRGPHKRKKYEEEKYSSSNSAGRKPIKRREFGNRKQEGDKAPPQMRDNGGKLKRGLSFVVPYEVNDLLFSNFFRRSVLQPIWRNSQSYTK
ncbi:uncharacterized protein LOC132060291 [Lycium ferocissimum]|uniref:uncharacterized protein LOC132060291 n=1 Tax=Lycium ferocissimum TaxID=112874 RepID=UPI002815479A|nr:uncharacterized protein LOC132060291 [Lycium ferocissimum]